LKTRKIALFSKVRPGWVKSGGSKRAWNNQDTALLQALFKSGKTVIIDGHYTIGADHLFIEKIDGQTYRGKE